MDPIRTNNTRPITISIIRLLAFLVFSSLPPAFKYCRPKIETPMAAKIPAPMDNISMISFKMCPMPFSFSLQLMMAVSIPPQLLAYACLAPISSIINSREIVKRVNRYFGIFFFCILLIL